MSTPITPLLQRTNHLKRRADPVDPCRVSVTLRAPKRCSDVDTLAVLAPGAVRAAVQPIIRASDLSVIGYEALARMTVKPVQGPDWWLARAEEAGLRSELELVCLDSAAALGDPPDGQLLFVNVSPSTVSHPDFISLLAQLPGRLVLELSECEEVGDYQRLRAHLAPLVERGIRLAIDDAGAGYSSLRHVIELAPDFLKLDREMVRGVDRDPVRLALVRAMVAFAGEVGTHIVGEGVETRDELDALRDAGVDFLQGYLTGRPAFGWAATGVGQRIQTVSIGTAGHRQLREKLAACDDAESACGAVAHHLAAEGMMPSVYLVRGGSLRCMAQRGLWQVLDGLAANTGITGRTWASAEPIIVEDVRADPDYLEAIPGVVSEICVPILAGGRPIGAINVESCLSMPAGMVEALQDCAEALSERLESIRHRDREDRWQDASRASIRISALRPGPGVARQALEFALSAAEIDSGAIILEGPPRRRIVTTLGPLASALAQLRRDDLDHLTESVNRIRSCYSAGDPSGRCFLGTASLRESGARAVLVLPLWTQKRRVGTLVLAHSRPTHLQASRVEPLEVLADHIAAALVLNGATSPGIV